MKAYYPAVIRQENDHLVAVFPDFPILTVVNLTWENLYDRLKNGLQHCIDFKLYDTDVLPMGTCQEFNSPRNPEYGYGFSLELSGIWSRGRVSKPIAVILVEVDVPEDT